MGVFNLGGVIRAFNPDKIVRRSLFEPLDRNYTELSDRASRVTSANEADEGALSGEISRITPTIRKFADEDAATLGGMAQQFSKRDPFALYQQLSTFNLDQADRVAQNLANRGMSKLNLRRAGMGYGGRGPSSFDTASVTNLISGNLAPLYAQMAGQTGRDLGMIEDSNRGNADATVNLLRERSATPLRVVDLLKQPALFRLGNQSGEIGNIGALTQAVKEGTAGFERKTNKWADAVSAVDESLNSALDTAMSLYSGGAFNGLLGGGKGGGGGLMGGGGGGQPMPQQSWFPMQGGGGGGWMNGWNPQFSQMFNGWNGGMQWNPFMQYQPPMVGSPNFIGPIPGG